MEKTQQQQQKKKHEMDLWSTELYLKYPQIIGSWGKTEIYLSPDP